MMRPVKTTARKPWPSKHRRHEWQETTGSADTNGPQTRRCSVCHLEQTRTSRLVLWPNSGFCPGPARLVAPKR